VRVHSIGIGLNSCIAFDFAPRVLCADA